MESFVEDFSSVFRRRLSVRVGTSLMRVLVLGGVFSLILTLYGVPSTPAQASPSSPDSKGVELPFFPPDLPEQGENPFQLAVESYHAGDSLLAIQETQRLKETLPPGPASETAAFLLGDLHLKWALDTPVPDGEARSSRLNDALAAFQDAVVRYPDSENAVRGLWRMGQIYRRLALYPESVASFRRVLTRHPKSPFSLKSKLGIAETYRAWGKLNAASAAFKNVETLRLSPEDRKVLNLAVADMAYQGGDAELAYRTYGKLGLRPQSYISVDPATLFQYGDSAYQSGHLKEAMSVLQAFRNIYPKDPLAAVALARMGEAWRTDKKTKGAAENYDAVRNELLLTESNTVEEKVARLLSAVGSLSERRECVLALPQIRPSGCVPPDVQEATKSEGALPPHAVREVVDLSYALIREDTLPAVFQDVLFAAAKGLRRQGYLDAPLAIENRLLSGRKTEATPFQEKVLATFQQTMKEAISERLAQQRHLSVVELYYLYPDAFSDGMRLGETGMGVARSLTEMELLSEAAALYAPISESAVNPRSEEALAHLGKINLKRGAYVDSRQNMVQFLSSYPSGEQSAEMMRIFGDLFEQEGDTASAIERYQDWLARHPGHPDRSIVMSSLGGAYVKAGNLDAASGVYGTILESGAHPSPENYVRGGDVAYRLGRYQDAIAYYELGLKANPEFEYASWVHLQIANSYRAIGQVEKGQAIFSQLAEKSDDPIIRHLAAEKVRALR